ncbi:hypothetical protein LTR56_009904 [Elasticomyces elasticus]|nr:hypothetical protein LTR56_009904 [Elasticomyces elasticus]KAK3659220.1 hypothetical protein LTR22_008683 [Elasticomyces elasticus]KAK4923104.1 hypothetical protein LTR49_009572 [Elasticomyces elasticus]KAK5761488.1 hypothetical protein LTS12_008280 [Elasticomyces elasticus]
MRILLAWKLLPIAANRLVEASWTGWGGNILNNRWNDHTTINRATVQNISRHCHLGGFAQGISAAPAIHEGVAYFPSWDGYVTAFAFETCEVKWQTNITAYLEEYAVPNAYQMAFCAPASRTSPQIDRDVLYVGTLRHAVLLALDITTGAILANVQINPHPLAVVTMSPTFYNGKIFVGTASQEESAATDSVTTGNVYEIPEAVQACINATSSNSSDLACYPSSVWHEAVLALDIDCGNVNWIKILSPLEAWNAACGIAGVTPKSAACPPNPGPDADFGMAPAFVPAQSAATPNGRDVVVTGQKTGDLYAMDAADGAIMWATIVGPDTSSFGALVWGVAVDASRVYFTVQDPLYETWTSQPSGKKISNAAYGAVELCNGSIIWEVPVPFNSTSYGPPSVTQDVALFPRMGHFIPPTLANGTMGSVVVLDSASSSIVADIPADYIVYGSVAADGPFIMFGTGYHGSTTFGSFNVFKVSKGR